MTIDTKLITSLREKTGAGIVDCKRALEEAEGDITKAIEILRKEGILKASKKMERETCEGLIYAYLHPNGKIGAMIELDCETDFVARNSEFKDLARDLAMQVAATDPLYLKSEDVPAEVAEKEENIYREALLAEGKPVDLAEKIMSGKMEKYFEEVCLLNQPFIKDEKMTVAELINQKIAKLGEKIEVKRFVRFQI